MSLDSSRARQRKNSELVNTLVRVGSGNITQTFCMSSTANGKTYSLNPKLPSELERIFSALMNSATRLAKSVHVRLFWLWSMYMVAHDRKAYAISKNRQVLKRRGAVVKSLTKYYSQVKPTYSLFLFKTISAESYRKRF